MHHVIILIVLSVAYYLPEFDPVFPLYICFHCSSLQHQASCSKLGIISFKCLVTLSKLLSEKTTFQLVENKCQQTEGMYKPLLLHPLHMTCNWWRGSCFGYVASIFTSRNPLTPQKIWTRTVVVFPLYITKQRGWESSWSHNTKGRMDAL